MSSIIKDHFIWFVLSICILLPGCRKSCPFCKKCKTDEECRDMIVGTWEEHKIVYSDYIQLYVFNDDQSFISYDYDRDDMDSTSDWILSEESQNDSLSYEIANMIIIIKDPNGQKKRSDKIDKLNKKLLVLDERDYLRIK